MRVELRPLEEALYENGRESAYLARGISSILAGDRWFRGTFAQLGPGVARSDESAGKKETRDASNFGRRKSQRRLHLD